MEEVKLAAIGLSPCVKLFVELLVAEAFAPAAIGVPAGLQSEGYSLQLLTGHHNCEEL